jgi:AraC-like DNA-binding protein
MTTSPAISLLSGTHLLEVLAQRFLPVVLEDGNFPLVVARSKFEELCLPQGVTALPLTLSGPRVPLRNDRYQQVYARWPADGLQEIRVPGLVLVGSGNADLRFGDYMLHCPPGTVIFIPAGIPHPDGRLSHLEGPARKDGHCELVWLRLIGGGLNLWMCHSRGEKHRGASGGEKVFLPGNRIRNFVDSLDEEVAANRVPNEDILQSLLHILLVSLHRELQQAEIQTSVDAKGKGRREPVADLIEQSKQYIQVHIGDALSLDILAHNTGMSRSMYTKRFRDHTGLSVNEDINHCRLERAKTLLAESNWETHNIMLITGLHSERYFRRFFADRMQMSPSQYRKQMRRRSLSSYTKNT